MAKKNLQITFYNASGLIVTRLLAEKLDSTKKLTVVHLSDPGVNESTIQFCLKDRVTIDIVNKVVMLYYADGSYCEVKRVIC